MTEVFKSVCRDLSAKGLGVFDSPDGRVVFVPGTWPGDQAEVTVDRWEKRYGFGTLKTLLEPSSQRRTSPCPHQGFELQTCGGCPWMIANYSDQLKYKQKFVEHYMERAGFDSSTVDLKPIVPSPREFGYRNRAQFKTNGKQLGFVAQGSNEIVDIASCSVLSDQNKTTLAALRAQLPNQKWQPTEGHNWNYIDIDEDIGAQNIRLNRRLPFRQGNDAQNDYMRSWLQAKLAPIDKKAPVLELFCGSGNFTEIISQLGFENIAAAEVGKDAVAALAARQLPGVTSHACDLFKLGALNFLRHQVRPQVLVLDPPRVGFRMLERYIDAFPTLADIFYVTCDIASFSFDINKIAKRGWQLVEVQPLDQFPHTHHVEALAHLVRKSDRS